MIETLLCLFTWSIHEFSKIISKNYTVWDHYHKKYVTEMFGTSKATWYHVIFPVMLYRIIILINYAHFINGECMVIYFANIMDIGLAFFWFYCKIFGELIRLHDTTFYYVFVNMIECSIFYHHKTNNNYFVSFLCSNTLKAFIFPIIIMVIWFIIFVSKTDSSYPIPVIKNISKRKICYKQINCDDNVCQICHQEFSETIADSYLISCGHYAHCDCFENWWKTSGQQKCFFPFCKPI